MIKKRKQVTLYLFRELAIEIGEWTLGKPVLICISPFIHIFTFINKGWLKEDK
jgi:hypothetical protein